MLTVDRTWEAGRLTVNLVDRVTWRNIEIGLRIHDWWGDCPALSVYLVFWCLTVGWRLTRGRD